MPRICEQLLPPPPPKLPPLPQSCLIQFVLNKFDVDIIFGVEVFKPSDGVGIAGFINRSLARRP